VELLNKLKRDKDKMVLLGPGGLLVVNRFWVKHFCLKGDLTVN